MSRVVAVMVVAMAKVVVVEEVVVGQAQMADG